MKKISILSFVVSIIFFGCSTNNSTTNEDDGYNIALSRIKNLGYNIKPSNVIQKKENLNAKLWFIFNNKGDTCGALLNDNDIWKFALVSDSNLKEYQVFTGDDDRSKIVEKLIIIPKSEIPKALTKSSYGICQYISEVGFNFGCWALPDNPLAYYYVVTTKIGDPITAYHYQWCADWQGNSVACPLNETVSNVVKCGPPE